ncbi:NDP-hexose 2,3-dehydratase family protein [Saccharothrix sp. S26]|uniref:NDP-hexose 2,3-dehydratase family protein n=1 Tax=Saccharothrix sp. S26 TaxID=2907215 RepID=UPI001F379E4B|nr:NDP-hexose 2,3-dehydratase family protein [Saccharothrix sp. S26]MCE7000777.1 NDP-hexose 2,3-dehydratase family protein [Saccharothrix sp. S26]
MFQRLDEFYDWYFEHLAAHSYEVTRTRLDQLTGWAIEPDTGNIRHHSGRFFSVQGLGVRTDHGPVRQWTQPIIDQPESGILGILVKRFHGTPHFLMQAKMEPGNINLVQLSPTVQATRSNYRRVHRGRSQPYLEYFTERGHGRVLSDVLQSEQGSWFLHKRNRNMIIEVTGDVPVLPGFCWLTREQLGELLLVDNLVNMDSRTVLAGYPITEIADARRDEGPVDELFAAITGPTAERAPTRRESAALLSWFTEMKARYELTRWPLALSEVTGWDCTPERISHPSGRFFSVIGVDVKAETREVSSWSQPILVPRHRGVVAFLVKWIGGRPHLLARAHTQAGTQDVVELAPTVQCSPDNYTGSLAEHRPAYLDDVLGADPSRVRFDSVHSEEGGRFYHAENRYLIVEVDGDFADEPDPDFTWITAAQLAELARFGNYVNVEARNLLACLLFTDRTVPGERLPAPVGTTAR